MLQVWKASVSIYDLEEYASRLYHFGMKALTKAGFERSVILSLPMRKLWWVCHFFQPVILVGMWAAILKHPSS